MQGWVFRSLKTVFPGRTGQGQQCFHIALDIVKIDPVSALRPALRLARTEDQAGNHGFLGQCLSRNEPQTGLKEANPALLTV